MQDYSNKKILVVGEGISGKGAKSLIEKCGGTADILSNSQGVFIDKKMLKAYDMVVISPSVLIDSEIVKLARANGIEVIGEIELAYRNFDGQTLAITGTNGKTTTTSLIGEILRCENNSSFVCGNIGVSFAEYIAQNKCGSDSVAVVEVSSFQLESIKSFTPHIAIITNISKDHLDRHSSMEEYAKLKCSVNNSQSENDYLILSQDDIEINYLNSLSPVCNVMFTSLQRKTSGAYLMDGGIYYFDELIIKRDKVRLPFDHNISNVLFAVSVCKIMGVSNESIKKVLTTFNSDKHRVSFVKRVQGKNYYNDSKGTNIGSTKSAIKSLCGSTVLIMGGKDKGYTYDDFFSEISDNIIKIFVIGENANKIVISALSSGFTCIEKVSTLKEAVQKTYYCECDNVLLSPTTSSFDMFKDYKERGDIYEHYVNEL